MMVTLVCTLLFNTQAVLDQKTDAMEFGPGTEMIYSLEKRNIDNYDLDNYQDLKIKEPQNLDDIDIEKEVMARLDLAGVRNADVKIVEGDKVTNKNYQLKISISPLNENELSHVKQVLSVTGSLAMGTIGDDEVMYAANNELFDLSDPQFAKIIYSGTSPYPSIKLKDNNEYDTLKTKASEAFDKHKEDKKSTDTSESTKNNIISTSKSRIRKEGEETAQGEGEEEEDRTDSTKVFLWCNKTKEDTYDKAFGTNDVVVQKAVKDKVLAAFDLNNYDKETRRLTLMTDMNGNAFDIASARAMVNTLNAKDYGFDIKFLYQNSLSPTFSSKNDGLVVTAVVSLALLVIVCVFMILFYGLAGITGTLTMLSSILITFFLFSILGFEFSIAALVGLAMVLIQSCLISVNYFEKVKKELKKGRDIQKANSEGYHKSFFISLDASAILFLVSVFAFLISVGSFKTFFGVTMIGSLFTFLITTFIDKWMLYWLSKSINANSKLPMFGWFKHKEINKQIKLCKGENRAQRRLSWIIPLISAASLAVAMPVSYFVGGNDSFFNNQNDFKSTYTLNISFTGDSQEYSQLKTKEVYLQYLREIGTSDICASNNEQYLMVESSENVDNKDSLPLFRYDLSTAYVNNIEQKDDDGNTYFEHYFTVSIDRDLSKLKKGEDSKDVQSIIYDFIRGYTLPVTTQYSKNPVEIGPVMNYSHYKDDSLNVYSGLTKPTNVAHNFNAMFLLSYLISAFAAVYMLLRHGLKVALTSLVGGTVTVTLATLLLILSRIPFSSFTGFALIILALVFNMLSVLVVSGNKETLKERNISKSATFEQREEIANDTANKSFIVVLPITALMIIIGVLLMFINPAVFGLGLSLVVFAIVMLLALYLYCVPFYYNIASHLSFRRIKEKYNKLQEKRGKKREEQPSNDGIIYVDQNGPHETIVVGINEFRVKNR